MHEWICQSTENELCGDTSEVTKDSPIKVTFSYSRTVFFSLDVQLTSLKFLTDT